MTTTLQENGRDLCQVTNYERHEGHPPGSPAAGGEIGRLPPTHAQSAWCTFELPHHTLLSVGAQIGHALRYDNGATVPINIKKVTGGTAGVQVTALVP